MTDNILIIEGDPALRKELTSASTEAGFAVVDVPDYLEALLKLDTFKPSLTILDEKLPLVDGWEACSQLHRAFNIPVIVLGEDSSDEVWKRVMEAKADLYLVKPLRYRELVARVKAILRRYKAGVKMSK